MKKTKTMRQLIKSFFDRPIAIFITAAILSLVPTIAIFYKIITGDIPLWYDPSRDLLLGLENIHKLTLIGPTSGISGVFYGPYWIWLLSFGQLFSYDPRVIIIIVLTIPYLIFFPVILSRFSKVISPFTLIMLWILFLLGFMTYLTGLWNPHPAPLLILLVIYLLFIKTNEMKIKNFMKVFFAGITAGLVMNFHLSFGIGMFFGVFIYLLGESIIHIIRDKHVLEVIRQKFITIVLFVGGCIVSFGPFLFFEIRHQFLQTKVLINALTHYGGVVSLKGLSKVDIVRLFFNPISQLLNIPFVPAVFLLIFISILYIFKYKKRHDTKKKSELKLLLILFSISVGILYIYLTAKNPVWSYHFIGVEILFLLLLGILIDKSRFFQIVLGIWIVFLVSNTTIIFSKSLTKDPKRFSGSLMAEKEIVSKIQKESNNKEYVVFAYSPSIYIYEYSYLFKWLYQKNIPYDPGQVQPGSSLVYMIIPESAKNMYNSYIEYRTPSKQYKTVKSWKMNDGTEIVQRVKISK